MQTAILTNRWGEFTCEIKPFGCNETGMSLEEVEIKVSNLIENGFKYSK